MVDKRDIRLYYYDAGQLKKNDTRKKYHHFETLEEVREMIESYKYRKLDIHFRQWVIVEYFDKYKSKIIEII